MRTFVKAALLALSIATTPAFADAIPESERAAITESVDAFNAAVLGDDMAATFDFMPGKILSRLSKQSGLSEEALKAAMMEQIEIGMETVTIDSFGMDMETATWQMTPDGSRGYALIPTITEMTVEGVGKVRSEGGTLSFEDEGKWLLVRVDDPIQVQLLTASYPEFTGVTFEPANLTVLE